MATNRTDAMPPAKLDPEASTKKLWLNDGGRVFRQRKQLGLVLPMGKNPARMHSRMLRWAIVIVLITDTRISG